MIGQTISHYKILEKLGEGGMGIVYKAQDIKLDRLVALKFLPSYLDVNEEQTARFINEAKTASSIDHQNIGVIHEIGETESGDLFIAMAYYEGETLEKKIQNGSLGNEKVIEIAAQIAKGLVKAHERGIIHRDLKPANIIITKDGVAKIIDFGLAKLSTGSQLTRSGTSVGTAAFMSPEQARGETVNTSSDIWSLGVIMYQMATGRLPYTGEYEAIVLYKILNESPEPPKNFNSEILPSLEAIIEKAMQKDVALRYNSADEIVKDLELQRTPVVSTPSRPVIDPNQKEEFTLPRRYLRIGLGILLAAMITFMWYRWNPFQSGSEYHTFLILPITNQGDQLHDYLAEGITKDITSRFSKNNNLKVISSRTAFLYKDNNQESKQLTELLDADVLLRGTLSIESRTVNLAINLVDTKKQEIVWSKEYQQQNANIVELVNLIIADISGELGIQPADNDLLGKATPEIYDGYLRALFYSSKDRQSDSKLAVEYLSEILKKDSLFVPALLRLSEVMLAKYEAGWDIHESVLDETEKLCRKALSIDSASAGALVGLGRIENLRGNLQLAIEFWQNAVQKEPLNTSANTLLAQTYLFNLNEPAKGVVYLKKLQDADPTDWYNTSNVGVGYGQLKDYPQAIYWFRQSLKLNPHNDLSWVNLGFTMELSSKFDSAVECYQKAIVENPRNLIAYENAVSVLLAKGSFSKAESILLPGINLLNNNHRFIYLKGITQFLGSRKSEAGQTFREGLKFIDDKIAKNPQIADYILFKGLFHARLGNTSEAVAAARLAAKLDSSNSETNIIIARIYSILKNKPLTLHWFGRAKAMNPEYDAHYLSTALDFEYYRNDPELNFAARQN